MILFLDYDGVLHPDAVYLVNGRPELRAAGELFMWAPILQEILEPYSDVNVVLSTSWVKVLKSFSRVRSYLPFQLRHRVIGATWHSAMARHHEGAHRVDASWFSELSRYEQIARYVARAGLAAEHWIAIDDDSAGWDSEFSFHLVKTDGTCGLSDSSVQTLLQLRLDAIAERTT